jgi:hypothetical protein
MKLTAKAKAAFAAWGKQGGYARNKGKTKEQRSAIAKRAWVTRRYRQQKLIDALKEAKK